MEVVSSWDVNLRERTGGWTFLVIDRRTPDVSEPVEGCVMQRKDKAVATG
jgi:hypothetical protein